MIPLWVLLFSYNTYYMLQVKQDAFFPADLLFLASTNADGVTVSCDVVCDLNLWLSYCLFGHVCWCVFMCKSRSCEL